MRQQINLFQESLRPKRVIWSAKHLGKILIVVLGLLFAIEAFGLWQTWNIKQQLADNEAQLKARQAELKDVEVEYPQPRENQHLLKRVKQLDAEVRQKQQILGILSEKEYGNSRGFADNLSGLSKQHIEGIWLTRLMINQGGKQMGISGSSVKPELVPQFLQHLGNEASFAGKEFRSFQMSRAETNEAWVNFELSTEMVSETQP